MKNNQAASYVEKAAWVFLILFLLGLWANPVMADITVEPTVGSLAKKGFELEQGGNVSFQVFAIANSEKTDENYWVLPSCEIYSGNERISGENFKISFEPENRFVVSHAPVSKVKTPPPKHVDTYVKIAGDDRFLPARSFEVTVSVSENTPPGNYGFIFVLSAWQPSPHGMSVFPEAVTPTVPISVEKPGAPSPPSKLPIPPLFLAVIVVILSVAIVIVVYKRRILGGLRYFSRRDSDILEKRGAGPV